MYGDIKQKYLDELDKVGRNIARSTFKGTKNYEEKLNKDICEMSEEELIECLRLFNRTQAGLSTRIVSINGYLEWCKNKGYCNFNRVSTDSIPRKRLIEKVGISGLDYISPEKFNHYCNQIRECSNGILYETFIRCLYEGVEDNNYENLNQLRLADIDRYDHSVGLQNGKTINISLQLEDLLLKCAELKEIEGTLVKRRPAVFVEYPYADSIFKTTTVAPKNPVRHFTRYLVEIKDIIGAVRADSIRESGMFNRVSKKAKEMGYDLETDLSSDIILTTGGLNKAMAYQTIFLQLGIDTSWDKFCKRYNMWAEYVYEAE